MHDWNKTRDELGFVHTLQTGTPGYFVKVEKSQAGDYFITAQHEENDLADGPVEYRKDLRSAKRHAERLVLSDKWRELLDDEFKPDVVAVASYANGAHVGLSINGQFVLSFPARLVDGVIPSVDEAEWIMTGAEVRTACDRFNLARQSRVSLAKPEAPECVAHLADVPQESNADVMARAVAVVRANRITREYVAASAADSILSGVLAIAPPDVVTALAMADDDARLAAEYVAVKDGDAMMIDIDDGGSGSWPFVVRDCDHDPIARFSYRADAELFKGEKERALAAEQARADAARKLAGGI